MSDNDNERQREQLRRLRYLDALFHDTYDEVVVRYDPQIIAIEPAMASQQSQQTTRLTQPIIDTEVKKGDSNKFPGRTDQEIEALKWLEGQFQYTWDSYGQVAGVYQNQSNDSLHWTNDMTVNLYKRRGYKLVANSYQVSGYRALQHQQRIAEALGLSDEELHASFRMNARRIPPLLITLKGDEHISYSGMDMEMDE